MIVIIMKRCWSPFRGRSFSFFNFLCHRQSGFMFLICCCSLNCFLGFFLVFLAYISYPCMILSRWLLQTSASVSYGCSFLQATDDTKAHYTATLMKSTKDRVATSLVPWQRLDRHERDGCWEPRHISTTFFSLPLTDLIPRSKKEMNQHSFSLTFYTHSHMCTHTGH